MTTLEKPLPKAGLPARVVTKKVLKLEAFGAEIDALKKRTLAQVGATDETYIRRIIGFKTVVEWGSRLVILGSAIFFNPVGLVVGILGLSASQIIENMEIGHNVIHGQYDFMNDDKIHSKTYEWDVVTPAEQWKHSHNYVHHTYTNVVGRDRDIGYGFIRLSDDIPWKPHHSWQIAFSAWLALFFQHLASLHDARPAEYHLPKGWRPPSAEERPSWSFHFKKVWQYQKKAIKKILRDYVLFPALAGPFFLTVLIANLAARTLTNIWEFAIIFCGHFTEGSHFFTEEQYKNETKAGWYLRQVLGSGNIEGSALFYFMTGHLSHQVEHHLFPDVPAHRYPEMGKEVQAICQKYGVPYNTGPFLRQFGTVLHRIVKFSFPGAKEAEKPGQYQFDLEAFRKETIEVSPAKKEREAVPKLARVEKVILETHDCKTYVLKPETWHNFKAGAFLPIQVEIDGKVHHRTYTISSSPLRRGEYHLTVKRVQGGLISNWMFENLQPGDTLTIGRPTGEFNLPALLPGKVLFLSGGSGITPTMSMLRLLMQREDRVDISFVHCTRSADDIIFHSELQKLSAENQNLQVSFLLDRNDKQNAHYQQGRINGDNLAEFCPDLVDRDVFLCGPAPMMNAARQALLTLGHDENRLYSESFTGPGAGSGASCRGKINFCQSGLEVNAAGSKTLLEEAEEAGLNPEFGCRMGICATCKTKKVSGTVIDKTTGETLDQPGEMVKLCVCIADGEVELEL